MNKEIKALLLVSAIAIVLGSVLIFYKSVVSPPINISVDSEAPYLEYVEQEIGCLSADSNMFQYVKIADMLAVCREEGCLRQNVLDKTWVKFLNAYMPCFESYAEDVFLQETYWPTPRTEAINQRGEELGMAYSRLKGDEDLRVFKEKMEDLETLYGQYAKAWECAEDISFKSVTQAKRSIRQSRSFAEEKPFSGNKVLRKALLNVPASLNVSHYRHVFGRLEGLLQCMNYTWDEKPVYERRKKAFRSEWADYDAMFKEKYYSDHFSRPRQLESYYADYVRLVDDHFERVEAWEVQVDRLEKADKSWYDWENEYSRIAGDIDQAYKADLLSERVYDSYKERLSALFAEFLKLQRDGK